MIELLNKRRSGLRMGVVKMVVFNFSPYLPGIDELDHGTGAG